MYLKRLEMLGFKSFAARTVLEFSPGITAVVGPNGAGKSNVADSMRWVLGEQSMRQLRGKKSEDIIFAGAHGKSALGMAEISITLDNSTGWVPSEYSEITVTRRSYRSGENEYLINKQKVRLKDVVLLLAQARIGHDSYTVVGQGAIDAALSLRAEERRGLFEDASGIRPYQVQRADADNRLRQTETNLERLRDIIGEIEPRLAPLAEQARRAVEYGEVSRELQEVLLTWYVLQWRRLQMVKERALLAEREQAQKVSQMEQVLLGLDEQTSGLRAGRQQLQQQIAAARRAYGEASDTAQKVERELAVNEERIGGLERQRGDVQQEERRLRERLIAIQKQIIDHEEQCDLADEAIDVGAAKLAELEAQATKAQKEYQADELRLRNAQSDLIQVQARLGSSQTELGRLQKQLGERNRLLAARREWMVKSQQTLRGLEARLVEEGAQVEVVRGEESQVTQRKQVLSRTIADAQQEMERLKTTLAESERQRRTIADRLNMLKNWQQSLSGYSDGVRALLRAPAGRLIGVIGPVAQLGVVPTGMEMALEAALGPAIQGVVVRSFTDAQRCLEYLAGTQAGKAMVVWLDREGETGEGADAEISVIQGQVEEAGLSRFLMERPALKVRIAGFAWRQVQCEPRYLPLFRRLLQGTVIAHDLNAARELLAWAMPLSLSSDSDLPFKAVVTLKGEVVHTDGWLSGGRTGKESTHQGLLAYERELRELPRQLEEHKTLVDQLNSMMSEIQRAQEGRRRELAVLDKDLQKITDRISELNKVVAGSQREQERLQTEIQLATSIEQQLASEVAGLEQEVESAQERVHGHEKSQHEMAERVEEFRYEIEERADAYRRQQDEVGRARTALAVKRQEAKSLRQQLGTQQGQAADLKAQVEQQVTRGKQTALRQQELAEVIAQLRVELEQAKTSVRMSAETLRVVEAELSEADQQMAGVEQQRQQVQQVKTEQEAVYRRTLLESQKAQDAVEALLSQWHEEVGTEEDLEKQAAESVLHIAKNNENGHHMQQGGVEELTEEEEAQLRRLRRRIDMLRSRLKTMGGCDVNAPQEYEETRTRYEFLSTQVGDMEQAALHLRSIIGQLDATMARQFDMTFQAVNARFKEHFTTLFNGGSARFELLAAKNGDDDEATPSSMPAGVEVIVQPPGKKVQDLSLLSGGERALVSAALLFALLEINPPPFCLLDEVDAALDESNVTRFCDILKRLAQRTQFIVITHNRVTMMAAQVLYGVSMKDSASRLISLRLEEVTVGDR